MFTVENEAVEMARVRYDVDTMRWKMSGWTQKAASGWGGEKERVETIVEADSMDEAFRIARAVYGDGIDTAQPVERS